MWRVELSRGAEREFNDLPLTVKERVRAKIDELSRSYFPSGSKKLKGSKTGYRIRVGAYRVLYDVYRPESRIVVGAISKRSEAYR